ncbi:MAG: amidase family protein [Anaerolineae bacterium]
MSNPQTPQATRLEGDAYTQKQSTQQAEGIPSAAKRPLDFTPFEAVLADFPASRAEQIAELTAQATLIDLQWMLAARQLTSVELLVYYLGRIRRYDADRLNSILELNPEALRDAQAMDQEREAGKVRGFMHGIPVALKDNINTGDRMHTAAGSAVLADNIAPNDAPLVTNLRQSGAVILGKNNLSEWANFYSKASVNGFSVLGGFTRNPYGRFDVGGSSSGSAVSVAANFVTVSLGTETTGSIVYPASQNAVVGLKPSLGMISAEGIIPITAAFDTAGPFGRNVTDVAILFSVLAPNSGVSLDTLREDALQGVRIGFCIHQTPWREGDQEVRVQAIEYLKRAGAEVIDVPSMEAFVGEAVHNRLHKESFEVMLCGYRIGLESYFQMVGAPVKALAELVAFNLVNPEVCIPFGQDLIEAAASLTDETLEAYPILAARVVSEYQAATRRALAEHGVDFLADLTNYASPYHSRAGFPALTLPAGYRPSGEPLGMTLFGEHGTEARLLALGYAFEHVSQVRRMPRL